jgi:hypothetical protein
MSDEDQKEYVTKKMQKTQNHINKQLRIAKTSDLDVSQPHRYAKMKALNCGDPKCFMCANPRKVWGEKTMQEKSFEQTLKWSENERIQNSNDLCGND